MTDLVYLEELFKKADIAMGKKLSTKDRKKLRATSFCGPHESFPITDCKHVAVAKAYLDKSKFSDTAKAKIAACINRKAKALKCEVSVPAKAAVNDFGDLFMPTECLVNMSLKNDGLDPFNVSDDDMSSAMDNMDNMED